MADVFISYAKADRPLALKLAAMLEAEGWKTWWDTSLIPGDDFRNEIMTELGRARAVIVIWTDASIKSDWVRSEAGRAQPDRKLIPVKLAHLTYKDLPPPFDVLHTENLGEEDKIKAAVVALLAKPQVEPSAVALLAKGFRYEVLTWFGIVGGALTLFTTLSGVLKLADWARWVVQHWKEWTHAFWAWAFWAFEWLGIDLPSQWTPVLSFLLFTSLLTIGQAVKFGRAIEAKTIGHKYENRSFHLVSWRTISCLVATLLVVSLWSSLLGNRLAMMMDLLNYKVDQIWPFEFDLPSSLVINPLLILIIMSPIAVLVIAFAKVRLYAALVTVLMVIFLTIIAFNDLFYWAEMGGADDVAFPIFVACAMMPVLSVNPLVSRPRQSHQSPPHLPCPRPAPANCPQRAFETWP
jgi:hypothetical protein